MKMVGEAKNYVLVAKNTAVMLQTFPLGSILFSFVAIIYGRLILADMKPAHIYYYFVHSKKLITLMFST